VAVILALLVLAALIAVLARWLGRRRPPAAPPSPLGEQAIKGTVPTFRVVALGLPGAGKTLLLASMFHQLQAPARQSYYLSADHTDVARLNRWFVQMADASLVRDWPSGTAKQETRRFVFGVRVRVAATVHEVLRLDYLEYAGELLTDVNSSASVHQEELLSHLDSAHALIGVVDGQRIRRVLDGDADGWARLEETLNVLIPRLVGVTCPISFVITKWDLLSHLGDDENARLGRVRDVLMANEQFRALVDVHSRDRVVRLIPVSAVGPGFARLDAEGRPVKIPNARVRPTFVDVPLSVVVPDVFDQAEASLNSELRAALDEEVRHRADQRPLERIAATTVLASQTIGRALIQAFGAPLLVATSDIMVGLFLDARPGPDTPPTRRDVELGAAEQRVQEFLTARKRVLRDMRAKGDVLEGQLPNSRLSARWPG
jgi:hypothetical protein